MVRRWFGRCVSHHCASSPHEGGPECCSVGSFCGYFGASAAACASAVVVSAKRSAASVVGCRRRWSRTACRICTREPSRLNTQPQISSPWLPPKLIVWAHSLPHLRGRFDFPSFGRRETPPLATDPAKAIPAAAPKSFTSAASCPRDPSQTPSNAF